MAEASRIVGILLAAGRGARFDPAGLQNKLLQRLPGGEPVVLASALHLLAALPEVCAVVRPDTEATVSLLQEAGCNVTIGADAGRGMGVSLVHALRQAQDADGWVIALADMPYVQSHTIAALSDAICAGAEIAVPVFEGRRGNPVAFGRVHLAKLLALDGDRGARSLLTTLPVTEVAVDDAGILRDIDLPADLA
jgi:molybdenum cofactor cytidylyltransferase